MESFIVNDKLFDQIKIGDSETMSQWLKSLSENELADWLKICNRIPDERSSVEGEMIFMYTLGLYCRELDIKELPYDEKHLNKLTGIFTTNILMWDMLKNGFIEIDGDLDLTKDPSFKLTEAGMQAARDMGIAQTK